MTRTSSLGRGLAALLESEGKVAESETDRSSERQVKYVSPSLLTGGRFQPRKHFDTEELEQLSKSISQKGVLQPILVRPLEKSVHPYEIIAGERRWQAAKLAKQESVPILICDLSDQETLEVALVENLQREDLNALEEAEGYKNLIDQFGYSHQMISNSVGKSRSQISNTLRLLGLPDSVKELIKKKALTPGHARALLVAENAEQLGQDIVDENLSVREVEKRVSSQRPQAQKPSLEGAEGDLNYLESELRNSLGANVELKSKKEKIILTATFSSFDKLDDFIQKVC